MKKNKYIKPHAELIISRGVSYLLVGTDKWEAIPEAPAAKKNNLSSDEEDIGSQYGFSPVGGSEDLWDD